MKRTSLILSMGLLVLASCSNDELVNPVPNKGNTPENAIGFNQRVGNTSRDTEGLETSSADFGVWAVKGEKQYDVFSNTSLTEAFLASGGTNANITDVVMTNYLVGFWNASGVEGYEPTASQYIDADKQDSDQCWYYEGLGNNENGSNAGNFTWHAFGNFTDAATSVNAKQYLKYWDFSAPYTYFYAYAPYSYNAALKINDSKQPYINFPALTGGSTNMVNGIVSISQGSGTEVMYACARIPSSAYANKVVDLTFNRMLSKIRLAFYETVPGYKVDIVALNTNVTYAENNGIVLAPTVYDTTGTPTYRAAGDGEGYIHSGNAQVTFVEAGDPSTLTAAVSYNDPSWSQDIIQFQTYNATDSKDGLPVATTTTVADMTLTPWLTVVPNNGDNKNDGFTLNVSLRFTSEDTGEVFYVYGARVYIPGNEATAPKNYVAWAPNTAYTYVFRISTNVTGTTGTPTPTPGYGPDPSQALVPIIFEDVKIDKMTEVDVYKDDTSDPKVPFDLN